MKAYQFILFLVCIQCGSARQEGIVHSDFFDLEEALDQLFDPEGSTPSVIKSIDYNTVQYRDTMEAYDLTDDMQTMKPFNINNPNWYDKYAVDTIDTAGGITVRYKALTDDTEIQKCEVAYTKNALASVQVSTKKNGLIADISKEFHLDAKTKRYVIEVTQELLYGDPRYYKQEIRILQ